MLHSRVCTGLLAIALLSGCAVEGVEEDGSQFLDAEALDDPKDVNSGDEAQIEPTINLELVPVYEGGESEQSAEQSDLSTVPTFSQSPSAGSCLNTGAIYNYPNYAVRMTVSGPPYATVYKWNYHQSCANQGAVEWLDSTTWTIPASGTLVYDYYLPSPFSCDNHILGHWRSRVLVNGIFSNYTYVTYYQSACVGPFGSCQSALSSCPATGACNSSPC